MSCLELEVECGKRMFGLKVISYDPWAFSISWADLLCLFHVLPFKIRELSTSPCAFLLWEWRFECICTFDLKPEMCPYRLSGEQGRRDKNGRQPPALYQGLCLSHNPMSRVSHYSVSQMRKPRLRHSNCEQTIQPGRAPFPMCCLEQIIHSSESCGNKWLSPCK